MIQKISFSQSLSSARRALQKQQSTSLVKKYASETQGLEFKAHDIDFYNDDIEKMKSMKIAEQNNYKLMLKLKNNFVFKN